MYCGVGRSNIELSLALPFGGCARSRSCHFQVRDWRIVTRAIGLWLEKPSAAARQSPGTWGQPRFDSWLTITGPPPPGFCVSVDSEEFTLLAKPFKINTYGRFVQVLILNGLRDCQNYATRAVPRGAPWLVTRCERWPRDRSGRCSVSEWARQEQGTKTKTPIKDWRSRARGTKLPRSKYMSEAFVLSRAN
jgi:hypothetical protein